MLKLLIVILLIGVVLSLFSGLLFLYKDSSRRDSKRTLYALGIRLCLATALLAAIFYGFYTGQLRLGDNAPWHQLTHPGASNNVDENKQAQPNDVDEVPVP